MQVMRTSAPTNSDFSARLLRDVVSHYRLIGSENPKFADEKEKNARAREEVADRVARDPTGPLRDS